MQKEKIVLPRTTIDIYKSEQDGCTIYEFDATECSPPEPMVNTIVMLEQLKNPTDKLVVTFFHEPAPLFERVSSHYNYESLALDSGEFKVTFSKK